jgi:hypothetical protein
VQKIGKRVFYGSSLTDITNLNSIEEIEEDAFRSTPWIFAQEGEFVIINGSFQLYKGKDQTVVIPEGVTSIDGAFAKNTDTYYPIYVQEVYIPDSVVSISASSFDDQKNVTIYIPDSVKEIKIKCGVVIDEETGIDTCGIGKIVTTAGSYAEQYAKENGIPYEIVDSWEVPDT